MRALFAIVCLCASVATVAYGAAVCTMDNSDRIDCFPHGKDITQSECQSRGCCWNPVKESSDDSTPWCFYAANHGYSVASWDTSSTGAKGVLQLGDLPGPFGSDIEYLSVAVEFETDNRIHFRITDANNTRWDPSTFVLPKNGHRASMRPESENFKNYGVSYTTSPFGIAITRASTGEVVWNSTLGGLVFEDQFLQISSRLPLDYAMYGLGEHVKPFRLNSDYYTYTGWARDRGTPEGGINLYGNHPFFMRLESDGKANGVFLMNSNAMDIVLQPEAITYRVLGGMLDFYVFLGDSPEEVVQEYHEIIGKPHMPPYWALGFHLCRWGYEGANNTWNVVKQMRQYGIPQDTQWNDIDYMDSHLDFTTDPSLYAAADMKAMVDDLHSHEQHYVMIVDPGISNVQSPGSYLPFDQGVDMNVFINDTHGKEAIGFVWPGETVFPDFWHPNATFYWGSQLKSFHDIVPFDGLWIDMNEVSNFHTPECDNEPSPPYGIGDQHPLNEQTLCMSSVQHIGINYNTHNMYGYSESVVSARVLEETILPSKRSLVISRSTFPNSGMHSGHWLGDNNANWDDLYYAIPGILDMNLFGIPLVGADICGFGGDTTEELCTRWQQVGAFYPFSRNHNTKGAASQEPYIWGNKTATIIRDALLTRYQLLPYMYTLFSNAHANGGTVARSLVHEFAKEAMSTEADILDVDRQFLLGSSLLISPVLDEGATTVSAYFPTGQWYDFYTGKGIPVAESGNWITLDAPIETINVHVRGGAILPLQDPSTTTTESRKNSYSLRVYPDVSGAAEGSLYIDDGETIGTSDSGAYTLVKYSSQSTAQSGKTGSVVATVEHDGWSGAATAPHIDSICVNGLWGFNTTQSVVSLNGAHTTKWTFDKVNSVLCVIHSSVPVNSAFKLEWTVSSDSDHRGSVIRVNE